MPICICKPFPYNTCSEKSLELGRMKNIYKNRRRYTAQHLETKIDSDNADKTLSNRGSTAVQPRVKFRYRIVYIPGHALHENDLQRKNDSVHWSLA